MNRNLSPKMIQRIQELVDASFSGRDELYAAARTLDDARRSNICKQLADHLAHHAIELQQLLTVNGETPQSPIDLFAVAKGFFELTKSHDGASGVLRIAANCERTVKERYDEVLDASPQDDTSAILQRQRNDVEFGEQVLESIIPPDERA